MPRRTRTKKKEKTGYLGQYFIQSKDKELIKAAGKSVWTLDIELGWDVDGGLAKLVNLYGRTYHSSGTVLKR